VSCNCRSANVAVFWRPQGLLPIYKLHVFSLISQWMNFLNYSVICFPDEWCLSQYATYSTAAWLISRLKKLKGKFAALLPQISIRSCKIFIWVPLSLMNRSQQVAEKCVGSKLRQTNPQHENRKLVYSFCLIILRAQIIIYALLSVPYWRTGYLTFCDFTYFLSGREIYAISMRKQIFSAFFQEQNLSWQPRVLTFEPNPCVNLTD